MRKMCSYEKTYFFVFFCKQMFLLIFVILFHIFDHFDCTEARFNGALYNGAFITGPFAKGIFLVQFLFAIKVKRNIERMQKMERKTYSFIFFRKKSFWYFCRFSHFLVIFAVPDPPTPARLGPGCTGRRGWPAESGIIFWHSFFL